MRKASHPSCSTTTTWVAKTCECLFRLSVNSVLVMEMILSCQTNEAGVMFCLLEERWWCFQCPFGGSRAQFRDAALCRDHVFHLWGTQCEHEVRLRLLTTWSHRGTEANGSVTKRWRRSCPQLFRVKIPHAVCWWGFHRSPSRVWFIKESSNLCSNSHVYTGRKSETIREMSTRFHCDYTFINTI